MKIRFLGKAYAHIVSAGSGLVLGGIERITGKKYGRTTPKEILEDPFGRVLAKSFGVTTAALGVAAAPYIAPAVGKGAIALIPKTIGGWIGTLALGGLATTPSGRTLIGEGIKGIFRGGRELGLLAEEAEEKDEDISLSEAAKAAGLLGLGLVGGAMLPDIIPEEIPDIFDIVKPPAEVIPEVEPEEQIIPEKPVGIEGEVPITPEVTTIPVGKKPYKRRRAKIAPQVKQSVRVNIINRATSTGIRQSI